MLQKQRNRIGDERGSRLKRYVAYVTDPALQSFGVGDPTPRLRRFAYCAARM